MKTYEDFRIRGINPNGSEEQYVTCPECSTERKKKSVRCLSVNVVKEVWICHHCGWKGSLQNGGNYSDPHWRKPEYRKPTLFPANPRLIPEVMNWFLNRGITADVQIRNKLTVSTVYMPQIEKKVKAIGYPYFRDGEHINTKWRDHDKNFRMEAGAELLLYGLDDIKEADTVIWVEGEMDKLSVEVAGFKNCVSVPNGAPPPESKNYSSHFDYLVSASKFFEGKAHILFLDDDEAGRHLESELSRRLGKESCKRVRLPEGFKDANEYLIAHGSDNLCTVIEAAQPYPVSGIHDGNSLLEGVKKIHGGGMKGGVSTGWLPLDEFYTVRLGEMTIVTGIPNHGKSNWLDCLLVNIAMRFGWRFGIFSPENQPLERHAMGLVEKINMLPQSELKEIDIDATMASIHDHFQWILPEFEDDWSLGGILDKAKTMVYRFGINGLVIDPWNEIEHKRPANLSETEYISQALQKIRQFGRLHNIHIWVVAHPSKLQKDAKTGNYPVPTPYDIAGSANFRNKADNCITVDRIHGADRVKIHVQKVRFKEVGKLGGAELVYDVKSSTYSEVKNFV